MVLETKLHVPVAKSLQISTKNTKQKLPLHIYNLEWPAGHTQIFLVASIANHHFNRVIIDKAKSNNIRFSVQKGIVFGGLFINFTVTGNCFRFNYDFEH